MLCKFKEICGRIVCEVCGGTAEVVAGLPAHKYFYPCGDTPVPPTKPGINYTCPHLRDPTDTSVALKGCGCGAMTMVYECELFGRCAPIPQAKRAELGEPSDNVILCKDCEHNPANAPATPNAPT